MNGEIFQRRVGQKQASKTLTSTSDSAITPTEFTDIYDQALAYKKDESTELEVVKVRQQKGLKFGISPKENRVSILS